MTSATAESATAESVYPLNRRNCGVGVPSQSPQLQSRQQCHTMLCISINDDNNAIRCVVYNPFRLGRKPKSSDQCLRWHSIEQIRCICNGCKLFGTLETMARRLNGGGACTTRPPVKMQGVLMGCWPFANGDEMALMHDKKLKNETNKVNNSLVANCLMKQ